MKWQRVSELWRPLDILGDGLRSLSPDALLLLHHSKDQVEDMNAITCHTQAA